MADSLREWTGLCRGRYDFFSPIPCTYASLPLDGMARNDFFYLHLYARITQFIVSGSIFSYRLISEEEKNIWSELELNPGPLASQVTALTTRPWLLGRGGRYDNYDLVAI